ncbi:MAG: response regulator transcription factor, partial [Acidobacteriota bacterium]
LTKPFEHMELVARVEALLRRAPALAAAGARRAHFGDVTVDFEAAEVEKDGRPVDLSALELRLLEYFLDHRGKVLSRDTLLDDVWGYDATPVTRTVDVHVASLRQKIEDVPSKPRFLLTVHGRGYKFASD